MPAASIFENRPISGSDVVIPVENIIGGPEYAGRGSPLHYAPTRGHDEIQARLDEFAKIYGERFKPNPD